MYLLVQCKFPFHGPDMLSMFRRTIRCQVKFDSPNNDTLSDSCKSCVLSLLHKTAEERPDSHTALMHMWFQSDFDLDDTESRHSTRYTSSACSRQETGNTAWTESTEATGRTSRTQSARDTFEDSDSNVLEELPGESWTSKAGKSRAPNKPSGVAPKKCFGRRGVKPMNKRSASRDSDASATPSGLLTRDSLNTQDTSETEQSVRLSRRSTRTSQGRTEELCQQYFASTEVRKTEETLPAVPGDPKSVASVEDVMTEWPLVPPSPRTSSKSFARRFLSGSHCNRSA